MSGTHRTGVVVATAALAAVSFFDGTPANAPETGRQISASDLQVVDCLLPGQVRKLGRRHTFLTQRRPVRTTALDCEIRGGEYVAYDRADYTTALEVWLESAEGGDPEAQYYVGEIHEKGLGTDPDYETAAEWYRKSAEHGYAPAQINLGYLYEKGLGVDQDPRQAIEWYRKASGVSGVIMLDSELEAIRQELAAAHERREEAEEAVRQLEADLEVKRSELESERASSQRSAERVTELEEEIASLNRALRSREGEVSRLEEARQQYSIAGPTIEIIDTTAVRGTDATSAASAETIVGRVEAPAGLESFLVDGDAQSVEPDGFFSVSVGDEQTITFVAIDLQGKRGELLYRRGAPAAEARDEPRPMGKKRRQSRFGNYHALIIGNDNYESLPDLDTALTDARALAELLETRYGFNTTVLPDAGYIDILAAFGELRESLTEKDNLLVYYAGHGDLDPVTGLGYWLPVDAERDRKVNWMSSREVSEQLSLIPARHALVIADSCYSGALTRSALARVETTTPAERDRWLRQMADHRSRTALTSGGLHPVLSEGGGGHSIFARAVLDELAENSDVLETQQLWSAVRARVGYVTKRIGRRQLPEYAPIRHAGHESGDFLFVPVKA